MVRYNGNSHKKKIYVHTQIKPIRERCECTNKQHLIRMIHIFLLKFKN